MSKSCAQLRQRGNWAEDTRRIRCRFPIAPLNTWSNAAYLLAALWLILTAHDDTRWVMAAALTLLGIGSAGYHGTKTTGWNNLDWAGMFACMTVLVVHGLFPRAPGLALGATSITVVVTALYAWSRHFDLMMGGLFLAAAIPSALHGNAALVLLATALFAVAYGCWQLDQRRVLTRTGHALWHVLTGAAMALLYRAT